jgi:hypothetical protein
MKYTSAARSLQLLLFQTKQKHFFSFGDIVGGGFESSQQRNAQRIQRRGRGSSESNVPEEGEKESTAGGREGRRPGHLRAAAAWIEAGVVLGAGREEEERGGRAEQACIPFPCLDGDWEVVGSKNTNTSQVNGHGRRAVYYE